MTETPSMRSSIEGSRREQFCFMRNRNRLAKSFIFFGLLAEEPLELRNLPPKRFELGLRHQALL